LYKHIVRWNAPEQGFSGYLLCEIPDGIRFDGNLPYLSIYSTPSGAVSLYYPSPWVTPTVIDIEPLSGYLFMLSLYVQIENMKVNEKASKQGEIM
jgi:hypothetical protein